MNRSSRMKKVHSREKLNRKTILKDETTDGYQRKKKFVTKKKRKKRVLDKKNTLMVGIYKNGAKSKEISTAVPALTASNNARLQGDVLMLLNGESKPKNIVKDHLIGRDKEKVLSKISPKELQLEKPKDPVWSPETCYKAFCTTTSMDFKDEKFLINNSTVTDYVQKIKKNLRQIYTDTFHRQILQQKAKAGNPHFNMGTLGLVHALDPSKNINFENVEVPACSYSENSELLLKPMNNIRLDSGLATNEFIQTNGTINKGVHLSKSKIRMRSQTNENDGLFPFTSDFLVSDLGKHNLQVSNYVNEFNRMPVTEIFQDRTCLEDNFNPLNVRSSTDEGKEMLMNCYLKCVKQSSKEKISYEDNILESEQTGLMFNVSPKKFVHRDNNKKTKKIPNDRHCANYFEKSVYHGSDSIIAKEDPSSVQLTNRGRTISDVNFERLSNEPLVGENMKTDYVIKKHRRKQQIPLVNSKMQFMKQDYHSYLHSLKPNIFQMDCTSELPKQRKSFEIHIPTNNNLMNKDSKTNIRKSKQVLFVENSYLKPQTPDATFRKQRNNKHQKRNMSNTINSVGSGTLTTSSVHDFNQLMLFEDSDVRTKDPVITPKSSQNFTDYFDYSNLQNSEYSSPDFHSNFEPSLEIRSNSKLHPDRKQRRGIHVPKNKHSKSKSTCKHFMEEDFVEKAQQFGYEQNNVKKIQNGILKTSHPLVKNISGQKDTQYLPQNKGFEENNSTMPIPVFIEDKPSNGIYSGMTQSIIQPNKYLAVAQSKSTQQRIPLYLRVANQNTHSELPHQPIHVLKASEEDMGVASDMILVPKDKVNGKVTLIPAMQVASHKLLPAYYKTSDQSQYYGNNFTKLIPVNVTQSWQPQLENQTRLVDGNIGVNVPNYYVLHNTDNENLVYTQSHYNC